ncbi:FAS1 domain-containing protein [Ceratobasidium sp. AG-I]|nr:FAS1 domain-containing protein [Ceratobasidium sp. AG-I]
MVYFNIFASVLLVASALVRASPAVPRDNDGWFPGFIDALNKLGLTSMSGIYEEIAKKPEGKELMETLRSQELSIITPTNAAFNGDYPSLGNDTFDILNFFNIIGCLDTYKRAPRKTRSIHQTTMPRRGKRKSKRGDDDNQVQVVDTLVDANWKRWNDETIIIRGTITNATVLSKTKYRDVTILPIDIVPTLPTTVEDVLCKPLVQEAPYGFTKLGAALQKTGLLDTVNDASRITLLAPIDHGFQGTEGLSDYELKSLLKNHFFTSILFSPDFAHKSRVTAASGKKLKFKVEGYDTWVSCGKCKAKVLRSDVTTTNGVVHVTDKPLTCD